MRFALILCLAPALAAQGDLALEGTVVNRLTGGPVSGARLLLLTHGERTTLQYEAVTNEAGLFRIEGLREGRYERVVTKAGYEDAPGGPQAAPQIVTVSRGRLAHLRIELTPRSKVRGRVLDGEGRPVGGAEVTLAHLTGGSASPGKTDSGGGFEIEAGTGTYTLEVKPPSEQPPPHQSADRERTSWATTYFPRGLRREEGQHIIVRPGMDVDGLDFRLPAVPVHRIRGTVLDDMGKPGSRAMVRLYVPDSWSGGWTARTTAADDGTFEFSSVNERDWHLNAETIRDKLKLRAFRSLNVGRRDVEGLTLRLSPPFVLEGVVEWKESPDAGGRYATAVLSPKDAAARPIIGSSERGRIKLEDVHPGAYRADAFFSGAAGYYLSSIQLGETEVLGRQIEVASAALPLRITLTAGAGSIRGTVADCGDSLIAIWSLDEPVLDSTFFHLAACDADGHFEFRNLAPRDYYAAAFSEAVDHYELNSLGFARAMLTRATRVHVEKNSTATVELKPMPWPE